MHKQTLKQKHKRETIFQIQGKLKRTRKQETPGNTKEISGMMVVVYLIQNSADLHSL